MRPDNLLRALTLLGLFVFVSCDGGGEADPTDVSGDSALDDGGTDTLSDGSGMGDGPEPPPETVAECFADIMSEELGGPDYDQFDPSVGSHCFGTNHQDIQGVQKVVFLGDSVTVGTPPTLPEHYYRSRMVEALEERFGELEVGLFAEFGARTDDLLLPSNQQLLMAFPEPEPLTTLVVMTVGGNDIFRWAETYADNGSIEEIETMADEAIRLMRDAVHWLVDDPERFPNGVFVIFSNIFEYTDATGDTASCALAEGIGLGEPWPEGRGPVIRFNESVMEIAVETGTDMIFMLEHFCGHGFHNDDPASQCYRGPDTERWFDFTCIHPTPEGHQEVADMFMAVVDE